MRCSAKCERRAALRRAGGYRLVCRKPPWRPNGGPALALGALIVESTRGPPLGKPCHTPPNESRPLRRYRASASFALAANAGHRASARGNAAQRESVRTSHLTRARSGERGSCRAASGHWSPRRGSAGASPSLTRHSTLDAVLHAGRLTRVRSARPQPLAAIPRGTSILLRGRTPRTLLRYGRQHRTNADPRRPCRPASRPVGPDHCDPGLSLTCLPCAKN